MYPALAPVGTSSRWYSEKQTIQEKSKELTCLEDKMEAKRLNDIQVDIPIMIRGQPILPSKITAIGETEEEEETMVGEEGGADDEGGEIMQHDISDHQIESDDFYNNMYDQQAQANSDEGMRPPTFNYGIYTSESP
ncbi:hypothetical protein [Parasitella parasitica]|uniref:Uncharacterized protein n=1 Tax=Parasitella parasitica TaxID=35722 RepID=A0A0B7NSW4_9FUNG|nr:hypothetical protein [Parasitella parasitica]